MGSVGSSVAMSILHTGIATELLLSDKDMDLAEGEAMDLSHGAAFYPPADIVATDAADMQLADAIVISAGRAGKKDESRLDLLRDNAKIVAGTAEQFKGFSGILVVLTNPVDIMTHVAVEASGLPVSRVMGTGTMLDTARLRQVLGRELNVDPRSVHAHVIGEHGDSEVPVWSAARIGGVALRAWPGWDRTREPALGEEVRRAAYEIIERKGTTNHAIGVVTAALLRWMLRGDRRVLTVTRLQEDVEGVRNVAISLPAIVSRAGAELVLRPEMDDEERSALRSSAEILKKAMSEL